MAKNKGNNSFIYRSVCFWLPFCVVWPYSSYFLLSNYVTSASLFGNRRLAYSSETAQNQTLITTVVKITTER